MHTLCHKYLDAPSIRPSLPAGTETALSFTKSLPCCPTLGCHPSDIHIDPSSTCFFLSLPPRLVRFVTLGTSGSSSNAGVFFFCCSSSSHVHVSRPCAQVAGYRGIHIFTHVMQTGHLSGPYQHMQTTRQCRIKQVEIYV